jgi:cobalt/nickel transport system permease protein
MHDMLDDYAQASALREVNPRLKLLLGLGSIMLCVFSTSAVAPALIAATMTALTVFKAKIPLGFYLKLLSVPISFAILSCAVVLFVQGGVDPIFSIEIVGLKLEASRQGANLAALLLSRTFGGMCSLFFIALTTPMVEIFSVLKSYGVPEVVVELSMLIYRYIFVLLGEAAMIRDAQEMRLGYSNLKTSLGSFAMLSSVLFLRAWDQGERLMIAMDSRCYDGRLDLMEKGSKMSAMSIILVLIYQAAALAIAILTRNVRLM